MKEKIVNWLIRKKICNLIIMINNIKPNNRYKRENSLAYIIRRAKLSYSYGVIVLNILEKNNLNIQE